MSFEGKGKIRSSLENQLWSDYDYDCDYDYVASTCKGTFVFARCRQEVVVAELREKLHNASPIRRKAEVTPVCVCLTVGYDNTPRMQLQRGVINVPDQQKADATLFIRVRGGGPKREEGYNLHQHIAAKLFASGATTCLFSPSREESWAATRKTSNSRRRRACRCERKIWVRTIRKEEKNTWFSFTFGTFLWKNTWWEGGRGI